MEAWELSPLAVGTYPTHDLWLPEIPSHGFCADEAGWNPLVGGSLGRCFLQGYVLGLPSVIALVAVSFQLYSYSKRKQLGAKTGYRAAISLVAIIASAIGWAQMGYRSYHAFGIDIGVISAFAAIVSLFDVAALTLVERRVTTKSAGSLLVFWCASLFATAFTGNTWWTLVQLAGLLAEWWPYPEGFYLRYVDKRHLNPYDRADILSRLTFTWMTSLMKCGHDHVLSATDLPELPSSDHTDACLNRFQQKWQDEITRPNPSLPRALFRSFGARYLLGGSFKMIQDIMAFAQPQLLRLLIRFVERYLQEKDVPLSQGLYISLAMFLVAAIQTLALHQYFERAFGTGMRVRSALTNAIFEKSLVLSTEARGKRTIGDTVNLMSIDTQRLQDVCPNGNIIWSGPFQIILCLISLYKLLGNSMWAGVIVLACMIPVNSWLSSSLKSLQRDQMTQKDQRTRLTSELLGAIKSIKFYAWEKPFVKRLEHVRDNLELESLRKLCVFQSGMSYIWSFTPFIVSALTFACYVLFNKQPLTTEVVFPAISLFSLLAFPMAVFPMLITSLIEASVASNRVRDFLLTEELDKNNVERLPANQNVGEPAVELDNATFLWSQDPPNVALENISLKVNKGELACLVGRVGSGKSSLLESILGNLPRTKGNAILRGSVAYVAQDAWIFNGSVRENILFGCKFDDALYQEAIRACALKDDLAILPDGDATMVGEKGISLSGGQKARLSLARAVYCHADVYLLDDPLSAVDEHVGRHIIDNVLGDHGLLASKAVLLATNSIPVLRCAHQISMIADGKIVEQGPAAQVSVGTGLIGTLLAEFGRSNEGDSSASSSDTVNEEPLTLRNRRPSTRRPSEASLKPVALAEANKEHVEQGKVSWSVYAEYARVASLRLVAIYTVILVVGIGLSVISNVWLKQWSELNDKIGKTQKPVLYLSVYFALGVISALLHVLQSLVIYLGISIRAARILHHKMLLAVIRAPMAFFETTPLGQIINRFSSDVYRVDQQLSRVFNMLFSNSIRVLYTVIVISFSTPIFIFFILPLSWIYLYYQGFYLRTSRELKRLDSVSKSPIFAQFHETLDGIATVRAFGRALRFMYINQSYIDGNNKAYFPSINANRWLAVRLEFVGAVIILAASGLAVLALPSGRISAGLIGLALSYALQITGSLNWIVRMTVEVETNIVSVERMMQYAKIQSERPAITDVRPPEHWPTKGEVKFVDYSTRYRPGLPLVLKNINLDIKPGEKIGIVGRTGAGKSSLTLALFRLIEPVTGHIEIDGVSTSDIGLEDLRAHLSIIPQDPQLFQGSIRDNLDPGHAYTDEQLWDSLDHAYMKEYVQSMEGKLDALVTEGGGNLSAGQRQLLCLSRALLTDTRVLVMDEATAAVDVQTDALVQQVIRKQFQDRTILTIAHRLNTVLDASRILVLSYGEVAEFASPKELQSRPGSQFYSLCKQGGLLD